MVPTILFLLLFNCFAAAGEELGWRGLLVPELNQFLGFMELALLSGAVWNSWPSRRFSLAPPMGPGR